jgi:hypothetical protein
MTSSVIYIIQHILLGWPNQRNEMDILEVRVLDIHDFSRRAWTEGTSCENEGSRTTLLYGLFTLKLVFYWRDIALLSLIEVDRCFRDAYCLHHKGNNRPDDGGSTHLWNVGRPSIIWMIKLKKIRWAGPWTRTVKMRNSYKILAGKPEGKVPLGRCRWEGNKSLWNRAEECGLDSSDSG